MKVTKFTKEELSEINFTQKEFIFYPFILNGNGNNYVPISEDFLSLFHSRDTEKRIEKDLFKSAIKFRDNQEVPKYVDFLNARKVDVASNPDYFEVMELTDSEIDFRKYLNVENELRGWICLDNPYMVKMEDFLVKKFEGKLVSLVAFTLGGKPFVSLGLKN